MSIFIAIINHGYGLFSKQIVLKKCDITGATYTLK